MSAQSATDAPLYGPREKHMDVLDRVREERDRRKSLNNRLREFTNLPIEKTKGWWNLNSTKRRPYFQTTFHFHDGTKNEKISLYALNDTEKEINLQFEDEFNDAKPNSHHNQRKRRAAVLDAVAEKRAIDVEKNGYKSNLERRLLNLWPQRCAPISLTCLVLMLPTKADVIFRNEEMPPERYMRWQHKTMSKIQVLANGRRRYVFKSVTGYDGCIVVFECEEDGAVFWAFGYAVNEAYKTRGTDGLNITISATDNEPCLNERPWLHYLGKGNEAKQRLPRVLESMCNDHALPLCTMRQANEEIGPHHAVEHANTKRWIRVKYGGLARDDDPRWFQLEPHWQRNRHIYMLTWSGHVIAYPEDDQNGKTDLYEYSSKDGYTEKLKVQSKSGHVNGEQNGLQVGMRTQCGRIDGKQRKKNSYQDGDNDLYVVHYYDPETREFHYWEFTNAEMVAKTYIGKGAATSFSVYRKSLRAERDGKHAWTWKKHVCKKIKKRRQPIPLGGGAFAVPMDSLRPPA